MLLESQGRKFEIIFGSVINEGKEGFFAELNELIDNSQIFIFEPFWSDESNDFTFTTSDDFNLPFEIVEKFVEAARKRVTPLSFTK